MKDEKYEQMLIDVQEDGCEQSALFATAVFPSRFGKICQRQADILLKGKVPKKWSPAAVCLTVKKWLSIPSPT